MPNTKAGFSDETFFKQSIVSECCEVLFKIISNIHRKGYRGFPFEFLDLMAGPGFYEDGTEGGVIAVHRALVSQSFPSVMHLIDHNPEYIKKLSALEQAGKVTIRLRCGDNRREALEALNDFHAAQPFGLIYFDANYPAEETLELIEALAKRSETTRMDWLMHMPAQTIKRVRVCRDTISQAYLVDMLKLTGKTKWLVKESPARTSHGWVWCFLTRDENPMGAWNRRDWYDRNSEEGNAIIERANFTKQELRERHPPPLLPLMEGGYQCCMCRRDCPLTVMLMDDEENLLCRQCVIKHEMAVYCLCGFFSLAVPTSLQCPACALGLRTCLPWMNPNDEDRSNCALCEREYDERDLIDGWTPIQCPMGSPMCRSCLTPHSRDLEMFCHCGFRFERGVMPESWRCPQCRKKLTYEWVDES